MTKRLVFAEVRPAGRGVNDQTVSMWNTVLADNPCNGDPTTGDTVRERLGMRMQEECVIAKFGRTERWGVVGCFVKADGRAANFVAKMAASAQSHTGFEIIQGNWQTAKEECIRRNIKSAVS